MNCKGLEVLDWFFIIQLLGLVGMCITIASWQLKNPRRIIFFNIPSCAFWTIHFVLLNAHVAALANGLNIIKDIALLRVHKKYIPHITVALLLTIWAIGLFMSAQWYDILPLIGATIFHISFMFRDNREVMARGAMMGQPFWFVYNLIVGSWIGVIYNIVVCVSSLIGMAKHEQWELGACYKRYIPNLFRSFLLLPNHQRVIH